MKFGKSLSNQIEETLPEWRDKFLSYKHLKKRLKRIQPSCDNANKRLKTSPETDLATASAAAHGKTTMTEEESDFVSLLQLELDKFNYFFLEKEEEYVIRQKELHDRMAEAAATTDAQEEQLMKIRKEIVDFHGEMVLLENYSALNYTGLAKILKKYDKRTGTLLRLPFIRKVLQQPFYTTDLIYKLVKECESMLDRIFPIVDVRCPPSGSASASASESVLGKRVKMEEVKNPKLEEIELMESILMKSTISALRVFKEIRRGSSTVSVFSLPPLQHSSGSPEVLKTDLKI